MKKVTCILMVCLFTIISQAQNDPIKILPLGNSITSGWPDKHSYRTELKRLLDEAEFNYEFVGTKMTYDEEKDDPITYHEGHWGWTSKDILNGKSGSGKLSDWIKGYDFDYVLLHLGTNDISTSTIDLNNSIIYIDSIIDELKGKNPNVVIFLAKVIPSLGEDEDDYPNSKIISLNKGLTQMADELIGQNYRIVLVDHYSAFLNANGINTSLYLANDKVHPNDDGDKVMAETWFNAIKGARVMYFNDGSEGYITELIHPVVFDKAFDINYYWKGSPDVKIGGLVTGDENNFSARYEGTIEVDKTDDYNFEVNSDQHFRFWLNDKYIEKWDGDTGNKTGYMKLIKGEEYPFRLEYKHRGSYGDNNAKLVLKWEKTKDSNESWEVVPANVIGPPLEEPEYGLKGTYYDEPDYKNEKLTRKDQQINFNWDKYTPHPDLKNDGIFSVVWEGRLKPLYSGTYYLYVHFNKEFERMALYLDANEDGEYNQHDYKLIDYDEALTRKRHEVDLEAGKLYKMKVEFTKISKAKSSDVMLEWASKDNGPQDFQIIPPYCLYPPTDFVAPEQSNPEKGLVARYYNVKSEYISKNKDVPDWEKNLINLIKDHSPGIETALDEMAIEYSNFLKFNWWAGSPDYRVGADYFVVEWNGSISLPPDYPSEVYDFIWTADNIGYLKIDEQEITSQNNIKSNLIISLESEKQYPVKAILLERGGAASALSVLEWIPPLSVLKTGTLNDKSVTAQNETETVPPEAFTSDIANSLFKILVVGEDWSSTVGSLESMGYDVRVTSIINLMNEVEDLSVFDQIWYIDYENVPDGKGKKDIQDYILGGGNIFFIGENFESSNSAYSLWRDSLLNILGAEGLHQSQSVNPTKIGFYYTNPDHVLSYFPNTVDSIKHLSIRNGAFQSIGNGTIIAGTVLGGRGFPIAVAFDYGELSLAPNSRAVIYLNSNNGENWNMYAANIAEYFKQSIPETVLTVQDGYGHPGSTSNVGINLENTQQVAGVQFILRDIPNFISVNEVKTTSRSAGFETAFNEDGTGGAIIILYSKSGNVITPGKGPIVELAVDVSSDAIIGESSQLQLENVILSDPAGVSVSTLTRDGTFDITALKGDVNSDGVIDILDLVRTINIILGILPEPTETELYQADCNNDNMVDILDVIIILNLIPESSQEKSGLLAEFTSDNTIELEYDDFYSGESNDIFVQANFSEEVAGVQMRFSYDTENLEIGEPTAGERSSTMSVSTYFGNGEFTVLIYSLDGSDIKPGEGRILKIPVILKADNKEKSFLQLEEIILANPLAQKIPVSIITGNNIYNNSLPENFVLLQNYPNPFIRETFIKYDLPYQGKVILKIYNSLGEEIRVLVSGHQMPGPYLIKWNRTDNNSMTVPAGMYIYELNVIDKYIKRDKMVVLK
jgi:lysophospholipase L1-like esterase